MRLLPLILISGCVNWTPVEYYDVPPEMENEKRYVIENEDDLLCYDAPLGTFSCADTLEEDFEMKFNDYTVLNYE